MTALASPTPAVVRHRRLRSSVVLALTAVLLLVLARPAYAYWTATSTGPYGRAQAATLVTPVLTAGSVTATSATLSWTKPFAPTAYTLSQSPGSLTGCPAAPGTGSNGCAATSLTPNRSYTWTLSAYLQSWFSQAVVSATTTRQATTTALSGLTPTTGPAGTSFNATATVSGTSGYGVPAGTAVFSLYTDAICSGAASYTTAAITLTAGSATGTLQPTVGTYYWRATYTPGDTYNLTSTSGCSAAITVTQPGGTYRAAGVPTTVTRDTKPINVPYPSDTVSGDLVLLVLVNNVDRVSKVISGGWVLVADPGDGKKNMELNAWWHTAGAEKFATMDIKTDGSGATAWVLGYKNMAHPVLAGISSGTFSSGSSLTPANLTTTADNTTVISLVGIDASRTLSLTNPQTFSLRTALSNTGGGGRALGVADRFAATAGVVTSPTWAESTPATQWAYITMAFTS